MPTVNDNATGKTADNAPPANPELTDDLIASIPEEKLKSHPAFRTLEEKHAAARQGMDSSNLSKKELQAEVARLKVLAGVEETTEEPVVEPETVTKKELEEKIWELKHAKDVELYGDDEFKKDVENGIPREYALNTAKLRFQSNPDKARLERQQNMASGTAMGVRNIESEDFTAIELKGIADGLYSKETVLEHRKLKAKRAK